MAAKERAQCKACCSTHRLWIERLRSEGVSCGVIASRLRQEFGESVTGESLRRHFRNHFDVRKRVQEKYAASEALRDVEAGKRLSDIARLDAIIVATSARAAELGIVIDEKVNADGTAPMAIVEAYKGSLSECRQAIKQKSDLLGEQPGDAIDRVLAALWSGGEAAKPAEAREDVEITDIISTSDEPPTEGDEP